MLVRRHLAKPTRKPLTPGALFTAAPPPLDDSAGNAGTWVEVPRTDDNDFVEDQGWGRGRYFGQEALEQEERTG